MFYLVNSHSQIRWKKAGYWNMLPTMPTHTCRENCHWCLAGKVPYVFTPDHTCLPWEMTSPVLKNLSNDKWNERHNCRRTTSTISKNNIIAYFFLEGN
jgi:hypothetical protein